MELEREKKKNYVCFLKKGFIYLCYFWWHWVFVAGPQAFSSCTEQGLLFLEEHRLTSCGAKGSAALQHVVSSQPRDKTCVPCIGRQINH